MKIKNILIVFAAGSWITFSEFLRNELLFKGFWVDHYRGLGLEFQTLPRNGILWMVWSFLLALLVFRLVRKFSFLETVFLSWMAAFPMMWLTIYNLQVLPWGLMVYAVPLSLIELLLAVLIIRKFT